MKSLFDELSMKCSSKVTAMYSTSFSSAVSLLSPKIRPAIHSIYGFVRFADEIVDSFNGYDQRHLIQKFEDDFYEALRMGISLNPILNSFQQTIKEYDIDLELVEAFMASMKMDLYKTEYNTEEDYKKYIYGSADVVGLMCLKVFVEGDQKQYDELKDNAMRLGSAFQKVNFLRDLKSDVEILNRSYFPHLDLNNLTPESKQQIIEEIEDDFKHALIGISGLPASAKFGVYTAYVYYSKLLKKLKKTPSHKIMDMRIRVQDYLKLMLVFKSYFNVKLKLV